MSASKRTKKVVGTAREQEVACFVVGIDETFYLSYKADEWTENILYCKRFMRANEAYAYAREQKDKYPDNNVRVLRCLVMFVCEEMT